MNKSAISISAAAVVIFGGAFCSSGARFDKSISVRLERRLYDETSPIWGMTNLFFEKVDKESNRFPPDWRDIEATDLFKGTEMEPVKVFRYRSGEGGVQYAVDAEGTGRPDTFTSLSFRPYLKELLLADVSVSLRSQKDNSASPSVMPYQLIKTENDAYAYSRISEYREGRILIESAAYVVQLHHKGPGDFRFDPKTGYCLIDMNRDGVFQSAAEILADGSFSESETINLKEPFFLGDKAWRLDNLNADASQIELIPSTERIALAEGFQAPAFSFQDLKGNPGRLDQYQGKPVLIQFWSTSCFWSKQIRPEMNALIEGTKIATLAVAFKSGSAGDIEAFLAETPMGGEVVIADDSSLARYNESSISPLFILIDARGIIRYFGLGGRQVPILRKKIDDLLTNPPS